MGSQPPKPMRENTRKAAEDGSRGDWRLVGVRFFVKDVAWDRSLWNTFLTGSAGRGVTGANGGGGEEAAPALGDLVGEPNTFRAYTFQLSFRGVVSTGEGHSCPADALAPSGEVRVPRDLSPCVEEVPAMGDVDPEPRDLVLGDWEP